MSFSVIEASRAAPNRPALIADGRTLVFGDLVTEVAARTVELEYRQLLGPSRGSERCLGSCVALVAQRDWQTILWLYTLIDRGVPVVLLHPRWTPIERSAIVDAVQPDWCVDQAAVASPPDREGSADSLELVQTPAHRALAVVFTSGTGGEPKGVVLSRAAFAASASANGAALGWRDDDRWLLSMPLAHVGGLSILTRCWAAQRTVVLDSSPSFDPARFLETVARHRVTLVSVVPTMLHRLLGHEGMELPPTVRAVLVGGAAASPDLLEQACARGWPIRTTYGLTEACSQVATAPPGAAGDELLALPPVTGVEVRLAGRGDAGEPGVIELRGPMLLSGYLAAGQVEPAVDERGWFNTGDEGHLDERGRLRVLGRRSELIISGGENVRPAEVERVLLTHPQVEAACVVGVPDEEWGERVAAAIVGVVESQDLERWLGGRLASFKRPRQIEIVDRLPLNAQDKVDRAEVARVLSAR